MTLKEQFFEMLASLNESEKQQLRQALDATPSPPDDTAQQQPKEEDSQTASDTEHNEETPPIPADSEKGESSGKEKSEEQPTNDQEDIPQAAAGATQDQEQTEELPPQEQEEQPPVETEQPIEPAPEPLTDVQGEEMPIDYRQIVDGLNAKIMALETENASLKAKTEGAFGLTSKAGQPVAIHRLYDNDTSDIHFKK